VKIANFVWDDVIVTVANQKPGPLLYSKSWFTYKTCMVQKQNSGFEHIADGLVAYVHTCGDFGIKIFSIKFHDSHCRHISETIISYNFEYSFITMVLIMNETSLVTICVTVYEI
jgi:hypothetical protein